MKKLFLNCFLIAFLLFTAFVIPLAKATSLSSSATFAIEQALKFEQTEQIEAAIKQLKSFLLTDTSVTLASYDKAYIHYLLGHFYWQKFSQISDEKKASHFSLQAINELKKALNFNALDLKNKFSVLRMLADILVYQHQFKQAQPFLYQLTSFKECISHICADIWLKKAYSHFYEKQFELALSSLNKHFLFSDQSVAALSLQLMLLQNKALWHDALITLKALIAREPMKKVWWDQLVATYQRLNKPKDMLTTLILANRNHIDLNEQQWLMMAHLYAQNGIFEQAANTIHFINKDKNKLKWLIEEAWYWQQAKEWQKAQEVWQKAAKKDNRYFWELLNLQLQENEYSSALITANKIKILGASDKEQGKLAFVKANIYYQMGDVTKALVCAQKAYQFSATQIHQSWLNYLEQKNKDLLK